MADRGVERTHHAVRPCRRCMHLSETHAGGFCMLRSRGEGASSPWGVAVSPDWSCSLFERRMRRSHAGDR